MLDSDPTTRPTAEKCLEHQWFKEDYEVVSQMIIFNKHNVVPFSREEEDFKEEASGLLSFIVAPNYYR